MENNEEFRLDPVYSEMQIYIRNLIHPVLIFMDFGNLAVELKIGLLILRRKKHRREEEHKIQINTVTFVY